MDIYHIWCNLKEGVSDLDFADSVHAFLGRLRSEQRIVNYRLTRRKLGLGPALFPEFHIIVDFESLTQIDQAFNDVAARTDPIESFHHAVNSKVKDVVFTLYRDFPDSVRKRGEEKF